MAPLQDDSMEQRVSLITPAYKAANVIEQTIRSVQAQSYQNWEMLIAEDCGPDNTREIVRALSRSDSRIRLIEASHNGGPAAARNLALGQASGRWIAFLDSDDLWLPEKLERQIAFQLETKAALTFTGYRRISADAARTGAYVTVPDAIDYRGLLKNTAILTSSVMVDSRQTGPIHMQRCYYDDFVCWLNILREGGAARGLDEDLVRYRVLDASVSRDKGNSARQVWKTYREIEGFGTVASAWFFAHYAARAALKYRRF